MSLQAVILSNSNTVALRKWEHHTTHIQAHTIRVKELSTLINISVQFVYSGISILVTGFLLKVRVQTFRTHATETQYMPYPRFAPEYFVEGSCNGFGLKATRLYLKQCWPISTQGDGPRPPRVRYKRCQATYHTFNINLLKSKTGK